MRICKYCNKPIAEKDIWNPDNDGNGYHHKCLIDMEFKARDRQIYDKGKMDVLDKIRAEIEHVIDNTYDSTDYDKSLYNGAYKDGLYEALDIIDKYKAESEGKE